MEEPAIGGKAALASLKLRIERDGLVL